MNSQLYLSCKDVVDEIFKIYNTNKTLVDFIYTNNIPPTDARMRFFYYDTPASGFIIIDAKYNTTYFATHSKNILKFTVGVCQYEFSDDQLNEFCNTLEDGKRFTIASDFLRHLRGYIGRKYNKHEFESIHNNLSYICGGHITL